MPLLIKTNTYVHTYQHRVRENENKEKEFLQESIKDSEEDGVKCCMMKVMNLINIMKVVEGRKKPTRGWSVMSVAAMLFTLQTSR